MKKIILSLVLFAAMASCAPKSEGDAAATAEQSASAPASTEIVYVSVEQVLAESDIFVKEGAPLQEKTQKAQESWAKREQGIQYEMSQLQQKYQKGLITTSDATAKQQNIEKLARNYQASAQKEAQTLEEENTVFSNRAQDLLQRAIKELNSDKKYKMIVNANALVDADTTLNITPIVLKKVNELYASEKE